MAFIARRRVVSLSPEALRDDLWRLAANHRWTWTPSCRRLLTDLPDFEPGSHPAAIVAALDDTQLEELSADDDFVARLSFEIGDLESVLSDARDPSIAYCSPEFGITASLPQYAGGLGVLAGDHLKTASDLGLPLAGVGLFYREGVFRQVIQDGQQTEIYNPVVPELVGALDTGIVVDIPFPGRDVSARVWRLDVGRVPLVLLDTDLESNSEEDRLISDGLYAGSRLHRLCQEMVLGVGSAKALAALGWSIDLHHLNEGHAGFIVLELIDRVIGDIGLAEARERVRSGLVFTTHTPVPAGIDRFDAEIMLPYLHPWAERWGVPVSELWELGADTDEPATFNMAALCLRSARAANGVSQLHGEVSRELFAGVGIGDEIGFVTNGVHARTWTADHFQELFDQTLGDGWAQGETEAWQRVDAIDDDALLKARSRSSEHLARMVHGWTGEILDPDSLIIGFARRFAPYKRATLVLRRPEVLDELLGDDSRPVHFLFAGKAHPLDGPGKGLLADVITAASGQHAHGRLTFIPDYDMDMAHALVQGTDLWLNNPIRPREASGTSGEKAVLNGVLNCSVLDGWWAEMFDGWNGWEIAQSAAADAETRDLEEATAMLETIRSIASEYHSARPAFLGRIRYAWRTLGPRVTSARMLQDYQARIYDRV